MCVCVCARARARVRACVCACARVCVWVCVVYVLITCISTPAGRETDPDTVPDYVTAARLSTGLHHPGVHAASAKALLSYSSPIYNVSAGAPSQGQQLSLVDELTSPRHSKEGYSETCDRPPPGPSDHLTASPHPSAEYEELDLIDATVYDNSPGNIHHRVSPTREVASSSPYDNPSPVTEAAKDYECIGPLSSANVYTGLQDSDRGDSAATRGASSSAANVGLPTQSQSANGYASLGQLSLSNDYSSLGQLGPRNLYTGLGQPQSHQRLHQPGPPQSQ